MDFDEFLEEDAIAKIKEQWSSEYDVLRISGITAGESGQYLDYKVHSADDWFWHRSIHEIIKHPNKKRKEWIVGDSSISYTHEQDLTKVRDYYELLKLAYIKDPTDITTLSYLAWEASNHEEYDEFFRYTNEAIEAIKTNITDELYLDYEFLIQCHINLSRYYQASNNLEAALEELSTAISYIEDGKYFPIRRVYALRAELLAQLGRNSEATTDYLKCLKVTERPYCWVEEDNYYNNSLIYCNLSNAYYYAGNYEEALAYAEIALSLDPENEQFIINRDFCINALNNYVVPQENRASTDTIEVNNTVNKICVYAICKNESQFVDAWLNSMSEADYIVVLDTGSTDNTYEMLKADPRVTRVEQKVISPWRFDVARNESLKLVPDDANILICTDLDELRDAGWAKPLRDKWIEGFHKRGYYKYAWSHLANGEPGRIFVYDKIHSREWRWQYPVHEMLAFEDGTEDFPSEQSLWLFDDIYLHHYPDTTKSRGSYLGLLELRKQEYPNDYYGRIYLAHEYYYRGLYENSINELRDIIETQSHRYTELEKASCYLFMGDSYRALGNNEGAIGAYYQSLLIDDTYREPYFALGDLFNSIGRYQHTIDLLDICIKKTYRHYTWLERDDTWAGGIDDLLSVAYYWVGDYKNAFIHAYKVFKNCPEDQRIVDNFKLIEDKFLEGGMS
jgi:tetratricopeptide (TPR) repeat protein